MQDVDGRILDCNAAAERFLGLTREQMMGLSATDPRWGAIHADGTDYPASSHPVTVARLRGKPVRDQVMGVLRPDGSRVWLLVNAEPLSPGLAGGASVVASFIDMTEQRDQAAKRLRWTVDSMIDPHILFAVSYEEDGSLGGMPVVEANEAAGRFLEIPRETLIGLDARDLLDGDTTMTLFVWVGSVMKSGVPLSRDSAEVEVRPGEAVRIVDLRAMPLGNHVSITWRDVSSRIQAAADLAASEDLFQTAMQTSLTGTAICELDGRFLVVNDVLCEMLRRSRKSLQGMRVSEVVVEGYRAAVEEQLAAQRDNAESASTLEVHALRPDGTTVWLKARLVSIRPEADRPTAFLLQVEDVSGEREAREELAYQAFHDPLTGLHNRARLLELLERELRVARRSDISVGVLFIDLDNFKVVNDSLGHAAGDEVIATVANRIQSVLRPREVAGRFGGDEFVVLVTDVHSQRDLAKIAERVLGAISREVAVLKHRIVPTASVGMAISTPESTPETLLRSADAALFRAKEEGKARWHLFDEAMHAQAVERMTLESHIRQGLDSGEFTVFFQPIVDLMTGQVVAHEALARWNHPTRGQVEVADFIPVAEETGLIVPLGQRVLEDVAFALAEQTDSLGQVSINVSTVQLASYGWARRFLDTLQDYGVEPARISVEVTETTVLSMLDRVSAELKMLRELGVGVLVDDFGTGFSSIALLRDLPVTGLKLDKSFVANLTQFDSPSNALSSGLAGLAEGLDLMGVAEGVETPEEADLLVEQGWHYGQGYYYGRPAPVG